ncbi:MAG: glycosyltransferase [Pseudomonadota bacterium]
MPVLDTLRASARDEFDLTETLHLAELQTLTQTLLANPAVNLDQVRAAALQPESPLEFRLAAKLYESRCKMQAVEKPLKIGVVFAMWGEHARLQPKSADNPAGEDALQVKLEQLAWACAGTPVEWQLYAVDDGDPEDSGKLAAQIAARHRLGDRCTVMWLDQHLPQTSGPLKNLASADDSRKGGAIILGAQQALADGCDAVVYTDADNSVHLGQLGLLLEPFLAGSQVVLGNRKHGESVLVKAGDRWGIGIKVLRHMQRMVGQAIFELGLNDTQAAFKLYGADVLKEIIADPTVFDFSFDTDWIAACVARDIEFAQVPFAFIDSAEESASAKQNPMTTWETLLLGLLKAVRRHGLLKSPEAAAMADLLEVEVKDYRDLELVIDKLPPELAEVAEADLGQLHCMAPAQLQSWIGSLR